MAESKTADKKSKGFTADERAAMKARAQELKAEARASKNRADGEHDVTLRKRGVKVFCVLESGVFRAFFRGSTPIFR